MLYFHFCSLYEQKVSPNLDKIIRKKLNEYSNRENLKGINAISSYTGRIYILNITSPHAKVILEESRMDVDESLVVYFVRDLIVSQNNTWLQSYVQIRDGKWLENNRLPESDNSDFWKSFEHSKNQDNFKSPPPSDLVQWHHDYQLRVNYDIYESESWVKFSLSNSALDGMKDDEAKLYRLILLEIVSNDEQLNKNDQSIQIGNFSMLHERMSNDIGIVYIKAHFPNSSKPVFFLLHGGNYNTQAEMWNEGRDKVRKIEYKLDNLEDIQRLSLRAYPQWAIANSDMWKAIQKNSETGNLSLLPEQTNFLKEFTFPKYINGQAGSGKSTMLYYLFANAYFYKCFGEIKGDIIFLTENEELLKHTKKSVVELLQCNPEFELSLEDIANVDTYFISFKRFLLNLILEEDQNIFPQELYLDFSKFKNLYEGSQIQNHIKRKFSPELVWFAITTYIFGYDLEYQISSVNYDQMMPSEGKSLLSKDDLSGIEKDILPFYRKLVTEHGYWDKIKIINFIKGNVAITQRYEVIFCDEAQDFSRVELRFILSQSEYLQYDLSDTKQVPVVFAGDALQTVNPTGFRSAEVKDMLYQELKEIANFNLDTNNIEYSPNYNYRSSQPIVNIANAIQFYRKKNFYADIKRPQKAKRPEIGKDNHLNIFLSFDEIANNSDLYRKLEFKTFLVPTNSDEKEDYVNRHPFLKEFTNVKTAVEAKGIDYEQVVLFGFGNYATESVDDEEYESRFFYNKLYVAVTRAQYELIIIDSHATQQSFWQPLIEYYADSTWHLESEVDAQEIRETIVFGAGQIVNVLQSTPQMALENAFKDKKKGILDKNPNLLRVAANQFLRLGQKNEHYICLALMSKYLQNYQEAANYYLKKEVGIQGLVDAANVYWDGDMLPQFLSMALSVKSEDFALKIPLAKLIITKSISSHEWRVLYDKRDELADLLADCEWRKKISMIFVETLGEATDEELIKTIIDILSEIAVITDKITWQKIAEKNYELKRYELAIEALNKVNDEGVLYMQSQAANSFRKKDYKLYIFWLGRLIEENTNQTDTLESMDKVIETYVDFKDSVDLGNDLGNDLIIYFSLLRRRPSEVNLIKLARKIEYKYFENKSTPQLLAIYRHEFEKPLNDPTVFSYLLNRWAKLSYECGVSLDNINYEYLEVAEHLGLENIVFTVEEIDRLPEYPVSVVPDFPAHIYNIKIKNFRKFDNVQILNLSLVNLVVGDNNIGKTSFLESLLFTPNKREYLQRLAFSYAERRNIQPDKDETSESSRFTYKFDEKILVDFKNYNYPNFAPEFYVNQARTQWKYVVGMIDDATINKDDSLEYLKLDNTDIKTLSDLNFLDSIKQPFMPYGKGFGIDLAKVYFDEVGIKPRIEDSFLSNMKLFIPSIVRIIADTKVGTIEIYDSNFPDEYRPLHHYGEGANKLFRILILMALHRGTRVMIDEIDSGIHYTRFKEFWKILLKISIQDNTQLVVTTHNDEFINYYRQALEELGTEYQDRSRVVQMKTVNGSVKIRAYDYADFSPALIDDFELRGGVKL